MGRKPLIYGISPLLRSYMTWHKNIFTVDEGKYHYVSVPFTWLVGRAIQACQAAEKRGLTPIVGGPGALLMHKELREWDVQEQCPSFFFADMLRIHNPHASRATHGCPNHCPFCINQRKDFAELPEFCPRPIMCDDNFLEASLPFVEMAIDRLQDLPVVDFNQGLSASLFTGKKAELLTRLPFDVLRFAFDSVNVESSVVKAIELAFSLGFHKIHCYVLVGFNDTVDDALYRVRLLESLGVVPVPMRYQPLNTMKKNAYVSPLWDEAELKKFTRYWSRRIWTQYIPYDQFDNSR